jgi:hypothetical protein
MRLRVHQATARRVPLKSGVPDWYRDELPTLFPRNLALRTPAVVAAQTPAKPKAEGDEETLAVSNQIEVADGQEARQGMALAAWGGNRRDKSIVHLSRRFLARWRDGRRARVTVRPVRFCPNHCLGCAHCAKNGQSLEGQRLAEERSPSPEGECVFR